MLLSVSRVEIFFKAINIFLKKATSFTVAEELGSDPDCVDSTLAMWPGASLLVLWALGFSPEDWVVCWVVRLGGGGEMCARACADQGLRICR